MIQVLATIELVESQREAFLQYFAALIAPVRAENGCIEYTPMIDFPTNLDQQIHFGENTVVVIEKWASVEALEKHLVSPHMLEYRKAVKPMVKKSTIRILEPVFEPNVIGEDV